MPTLSNEIIRGLLSPYLAPFGVALPLSEEQIGQVSTYLDLLIRWNARMSLTAIRRPEEMVERHFGESFFTAGHLAGRLSPGAELLDYGSGPGFPGLPIQIMLPQVRVTVAESQARKVAFLREVVRTLALRTEVWPRRMEEMPAEGQFGVVTIRAVEKMGIALRDAGVRVHKGGWMAALVGSELAMAGAMELPIPGSAQRRLLLWQKL